MTPTPPRHVALLRGLNVGGHRIKMDHLRELFREMGFSDVETFIASGNVIFTDPTASDPGALEAKIEAHLKSALGYAVATFVRSIPELHEAAAFEHPDFQGEEDTCLVVFLKEPAGDDLREALSALESDHDRFAYEGRRFYWLIHSKVSQSPLFSGDFERALKRTPNTARNMTSLRKLLAKHGSP